MTGKKPKFRLKTGAALLGILILGSGGFFACPTPAYADDDPFQMDTSHWMSFDHYKDASKRGHIETPPPPADDSATAPPDPSATPAPVQTSSATPAVAAPTRPIDLPIMPGMDKGMGLQVNSTEDDKPRQSSTPVISTDAPPDIHLPVQGWQDPVAIQRAHKRVTADGEDDGTNTQLDVRMTYLPDAKIEPVASPEHASVQSLTNAIATRRKQQAKKAEDARTPSEKAACEAIDAYKKQQLDAIQSDRQTLKALQDAISSLGLQKQLDFITGNGSALNTPASQSPATIDAPAPTTIR